ncbi:MAG: metallopeptidase family protein [Planctomycetales bacterium]
MHPPIRLIPRQRDPSLSEPNLSQPLSQGAVMHPLTNDQRDRFDDVVEEVLERLPPQARDLLEDVPLAVEDFPSPKVLEEMGIRNPAHLCGLYSGVPLPSRSVDHSIRLPDTVTIYRLGILHLAGDDPHELRRQVRITILHEIGHHFGFTEEDLEELGYG